MFFIALPSWEKLVLVLGYVCFILTVLLEISYQRKLTLVVLFSCDNAGAPLSHGPVGVGFQYWTILGGKQSWMRSLELLLIILLCYSAF